MLPALCRWFSLLFVVVLLSQAALGQSKDGATFPVLVTFRPAKVGSSLVAQFTNVTSDKFLAIEVTLFAKTSGLTHTKQLRLRPGEAKTLGWLQKFPLASGDSVTILEGTYGRKTVLVQ